MSKPLALAISPSLSGIVTVSCAPGIRSGRTPAVRHFNAPLIGRPSDPLKRKRSQASLNIDLTAIMEPTAPTDIQPCSKPPFIIIRPIFYTDQDTEFDEALAQEAPSPTDTEIVEEEPVLELDQTWVVAAAKAEDIQVRDFVYEAQSTAHRVPELWHYPLHTLLLHDRYVRAGPEDRRAFKLSGKMLWRLLHSGLVKLEEARHNWHDEDWRTVEEYQRRPGGPYPYRRPLVKRPTAAYRARMRSDAYPPKPDDIPEEQIYVPPDEPGMDEGLLDKWDQLSGESATGEEDTLQAKKRRVEFENRKEPWKPICFSQTDSSPSTTVTAVDNFQPTNVPRSPPKNAEEHRSRRSPTPASESPKLQLSQTASRGLAHTQTMEKLT